MSGPAREPPVRGCAGERTAATRSGTPAGRLTPRSNRAIPREVECDLPGTREDRSGWRDGLYPTCQHLLVEGGARIAFQNRKDCGATGAASVGAPAGESFVDINHGTEFRP